MSNHGRLGSYLSCPEEVLTTALSRQGTTEAGEHRRLGDLLLESTDLKLDELVAAIARQRIDRLKKCRLFSTLTDFYLEELSQVFQEISVPSGTCFIRQDDQDPSLYVVAGGTCLVFRTDDNGQDVPLARLQAGEPVGEMGYFVGGVRSASVKALGPVELLRATYEDLSDCFETIPAVANAFVEVVTQRLRATNVLYQVTQFTEDGQYDPLGHLSELLDIQKAEQLQTGIDRMLRQIVHSSARMLDGERASLFLVDREQGELWSRVAQELDMQEIRLPAHSGIVGWVVDNNQVANVPDAYDDDRFNAGVDKSTGYKTNTILCAPIRAEDGRVLGALEVINKALGGFDEEDEQLIRSFAGQAAVAVDSVNLFRDLGRGYQQMAFLLDITTHVSKARDLAALSSSIGSRLSELFDAEVGALYWYDEERDELWTMVVDEDEIVPLRGAVESTLIGSVLRRGEPIVIRDAERDERFQIPTDDLPRVTTRQLCAAPVFDELSRTRGVIEIRNEGSREFDSRCAELLALCGRQVGLTALLVE